VYMIFICVYISEFVPHNQVEQGALFKTDPMAAYMQAINTGLEPRLPSQEHMPDCPSIVLANLQRLLGVLFQICPELRPDAEQARKIMLLLAKQVCVDLQEIPMEVEDPSQLLKDFEDRAELGNKLVKFYGKYNPSKLEELPQLCQSFAGQEEKMNAQMRERYKADLNGEYPDPEPLDYIQGDGDFDMGDIPLGQGSGNVGPPTDQSPMSFPIPLQTPLPVKEKGIAAATSVLNGSSLFQDVQGSPFGVNDWSTEPQTPMLPASLQSGEKGKRGPLAKTFVMDETAYNAQYNNSVLASSMRDPTLPLIPGGRETPGGRDPTLPLAPMHGMLQPQQPWVGLPRSPGTFF